MSHPVKALYLELVFILDTYHRYYKHYRKYIPVICETVEVVIVIIMAFSRCDLGESVWWDSQKCRLFLKQPFAFGESYINTRRKLAPLSDTATMLLKALPNVVEQGSLASQPPLPSLFPWQSYHVKWGCCCYWYLDLRRAEVDHSAGFTMKRTLFDYW